MTNTQLPLLPQSLPKTQADWQYVVNVLQTWAQAIADDDLAENPPWTAPTLLNGWTQYPNPAFNPVGYMLDGFNRVWLRGLIAPGITTDGTILFTLPAAAVPANRILTYAPAYNGTSYLSTVRVDVDQSGNVFFFNAFTMAAGSFLSLDQLNYSVLP